MYKYEERHRCSCALPVCGPTARSGALLCLWEVRSRSRSATILLIGPLLFDSLGLMATCHAAVANNRGGG